MSGQVKASPVPVLLHVELQEDDAFALAELCKRAGWTDCRQISVSENETRRMLYALDKVRAGLARAGVTVR